MMVICNSNIEPAAVTFEVSLIQFGSINRAAVRRVVKVMASTAQGARKMVRERFPRSGNYQVLSRTPMLTSGV